MKFREFMKKYGSIIEIIIVCFALLFTGSTAYKQGLIQGSTNGMCGEDLLLGCDCNTNSLTCYTSSELEDFNNPVFNTNFSFGGLE